MTPYFFIITGLVATLLSIFKATKNKSLLQSGQKTEGIIFDQESSSFDNNVSDKVTVRFVTEKQEWITKEINQGFAISFTGQYKKGGRITIFYDKENPNDFCVDNKQSEIIGRVITFLIGVVFIAIGLYQIFSDSFVINT